MELFAEDMARIDRILEQGVEDLAKEAVDIIAKNAPIWTGEYVSSITVETGDTPQQYARSESLGIPEPADPGSSASMRENARAKGYAQAAAAKYKRRIHIGNSAPHAHIVESQRAIYTGAESVLHLRADEILKRAELKVAK